MSAIAPLVPTLRTYCEFVLHYALHSNTFQKRCLHLHTCMIYGLGLKKFPIPKQESLKSNAIEETFLSFTQNIFIL